MQKEFFTELEKILYENDLKKKFSKFYDFYENFKANKFTFNHENFSIFKGFESEIDTKLVHPTRKETT